ncbi:MAG: RNA polymerase sigma factor [Clostridiales bacterium]|nr:RNA polymerase sigma factor [Clostridiales bacterium]
MKCYYCKSTIGDGSEFCPYCGQPQRINGNLLNAAMAGDQAALADLYNRTSNAVYNSVRFMVKDEDAVLDILQDTYIKAFSSLDQLEEAGKFEPWVKRIAHNKAIDFLRKKKMIMFSDMVPEDSEETLDFEDDRVENMPEMVIDRQETTRLIKQILDSLPEDQRAVISLFYYDELSVKEIASELGIPEATVKSRLQYGRRKIETQVRELEKKGTKLYSMAPLPFFLALLREAATVDAPSALLPGILAGGSGTTGTVGVIAAKTAGAAAKAAVGATVKTAIAAKIAAGVVIVTLVGGGTTAAVIHHNRKVQKEPTQASEMQVEEVEQEEESLVRPEAEAVPEPPEEPEPPKEPEVSEGSESEVSEPEESAEESEPATEEPEAPASDTAWVDAYQQILDGCQQCLSEGLNGSSPFLEYVWFQRVLGVQDGSRALQYALHDVNHDGRLELILAVDQLLEDGSEVWIPFEIYAFDGTIAVPLLREYLDEAHSLEIWASGGLSISSLQEGQTFYSLPEGSAAVKRLDEYLIQFDEKVDQSLAYHSILTPIVSSLEEMQSNGFPEEMIAYIKAQLQIPEDLETEDRIDFNDTTYWDVGEQWLVNCEFYYDGELVAAALVDRETGELVRNIILYSGN